MSAYNSPGGQKFIVYIDFPFPGGELSFPRRDCTVLDLVDNFVCYT